MASLWETSRVTFEETVLGFAIGVVLGVVLGVLLGVNRTLAEVFGPYIRVANSIPRIVLAPIFIIWLGLGLESKVATAVVLVFFVVFFNAFQGVREVPRDLISNARILGANKRQLVTNVILPSALTWITASLHTSFGFAIVGAVVGEFVGATKGLGELIAVAKGSFNPNGVFAAMFILAIVALTAEILVTALERRLLGSGGRRHSPRQVRAYERPPSRTSRSSCKSRGDHFTAFHEHRAAGRGPGQVRSAIGRSWTVLDNAFRKRHRARRIHGRCASIATFGDDGRCHLDRSRGLLRARRGRRPEARPTPRRLPARLPRRGHQAGGPSSASTPGNATKVTIMVGGLSKIIYRRAHSQPGATSRSRA